jgi:hypothetical protein
MFSLQWLSSTCLSSHGTPAAFEPSLGKRATVQAKSGECVGVIGDAVDLKTSEV